MQKVLKRLSQQQNVKSMETQQSLKQQPSSDPSEHNALIQKLKQMVAEKEAKLKQLPEIQQTSDQVKKKQKLCVVFRIQYDWLKHLPSH